MINYFLMNQFNKQFYTLLDQNDNVNNNLIELLILCKFPGIKMDIDTKILYISELVYQYYEDATVYEKEQINKLLEFIVKQLKFDQSSSEVLDETIFYKQQLDILYEEEFQDERVFGYNCQYQYECETQDESFF